MSGFKKPLSEDLGQDELSDRLKDVLSCDFNKPDSKDLHLGSPVSPLRAHPATTSSSSGSSGSVSGSGRPALNPVARGHSGELSYASTDTSPTTRPVRPGHTRSNSHGSIGSSPLNHQSIIHSGGSGGGSVNSPPPNVLPSGNICPSGRILKTGMTARQSSRTNVLGTGAVNYGHGNIMRGCGSGSGGVGSVKSGGGDSGFRSVRRNVGLSGGDPEDLKRAGNDLYKKGNFADALGLYDKAISLSPKNAAYRSNRAAALTGLGHVAEAVKECEEAVRLEPGYARAHHRLGSLLVRIGCVEFARKHLSYPGQPPEAAELQKLQAVEMHLGRCNDARKMGDWKCTLREAEAAIAAGADVSSQIYACKAESLLKLQKLDDACLVLLNIPKIDPSPQCCSQSKFFGMLSEAYLFYVRAHMEMSKGRFDEAITYADRAGKIDAYNIEISTLIQKVKLVARARSRGNDLFRSERFTEACAAYGEGIRLDPSNSVLYCNRAACWFKLGMWERSLEDCNHALHIQPKYIKALLRRAASYSKIEKWAEAVSDYEILNQELPDDTAVAESLFHAQVSLKKSHGEEVSNMKLGREMEEIVGIEQFKAATSLTGVIVVLFKTVANPQCKRVCTILDELCGRYPSINFLKVDLEGSPDVAEAENVRIAPTLRIYKNGSRVKEVVNPTNDMLEASVRQYEEEDTLEAMGGNLDEKG
ncbi:hypothetical protein V2J09_007316 [Rumex salicifolius]